jgi:very-short-patch-repair endonuclease
VTRTLFPGAMRNKKKQGPQEHELLMGIYLQELKVHYFREYSFHDRRGWRFDFAVPDFMLAIEMEGGIYPFYQVRKDGTRHLVRGGGHTTGKAYQDNLDKYNEATVLGWTLLRFSVADVKTGKAKPVVAKWLARKRAA